MALSTQIDPPEYPIATCARCGESEEDHESARVWLARNPFDEDGEPNTLGRLSPYERVCADGEEPDWEVAR